MKFLTTRSKVALIAACGLALSIPVAYQVSASSTKQKLNTPRPLSIVVGKTFNTSANRGTKIVLSDAGNILEFKSPNIGGAQYDHIEPGARSEGYVLCYNSSSAWDTGSSQSGFGPAVKSNDKTRSVRFTRTTTDGILQLVQDFTAPQAGQNLGIKMIVKNLSGSPVSNVILRRQVDFDVDTGGAQGWAGFTNRFASTSIDGVVAWNDPTDAPAGREAHAILLRTDNSSVAVTPKITAAILDNSCSPTPVPTPIAGRVDDGATLEFSLGTINPTASAVAQMRYVRF